MSSLNCCNTGSNYNMENTDDSELFASIVSLSPRFREISPRKLGGLDWIIVQRLLEACAETVESVLLAWWPYGGTDCDWCWRSLCR